MSLGQTRAPRSATASSSSLLRTRRPLGPFRTFLSCLVYQGSAIVDSVRAAHWPTPNLLAGLASGTEHDAFALTLLQGEHGGNKPIKLISALVARRVGTGDNALREIAPTESRLAQLTRTLVVRPAFFPPLNERIL